MNSSEPTGPTRPTEFSESPEKSSGVSGPFGVSEPGSRGSAAKRRPEVVAVKVIGSLVALLLTAILATTGWAYLKFRAIPKVHVSRNVLGNAPDASASTISQDAWLGAASGAASGAAGDTGAVPTTAAGPAAGDTISTDVQAAIDAADAADASAAKEGRQSDTGVEVGSVPPGPIVALTNGGAVGGPGSQNYLFVGVDTRADVPAAQKSGFGDVGGTRTDTIFVMRIDRRAHKAWILSIPRDLWVPIAGTNRTDRINAAFAKSPTALVNTVQERLGIPIDHLAQVNFSGFQRIVGTLDGVQVCPRYPAKDKLSSLNLTTPGCQIITPTMATAWVRSRHYEELIDGKWVSDPRSDLGRIVRQQQFIRSVIVRAKGKATDPLALNAMMDNLRTAIAIDSSFTFPEVATLANDLRSFDPTTMEAYTIPATGRRIAGKAVLVIDGPKAARLIGMFRRSA